jgi:sensor c-di-GMP phosphodiesterase-like protein
LALGRVERLMALALRRGQNLSKVGTRSSSRTRHRMKQAINRTTTELVYKPVIRSTAKLVKKTENKNCEN